MMDPHLQRVDQLSLNGSIVISMVLLEYFSILTQHYPVEVRALPQEVHGVHRVHGVLHKRVLTEGDTAEVFM